MIILSLGSNLKSTFGDRFENLDLAIKYLKFYNIKVVNRSSYYETPSFPNLNNPKFINIVIEVNTELPPLDLMSVLLFIEKKLERKRDKKNDPRTCDIDIIDYKKKILNFNYQNIDFIVPHKDLSSRNFVLYPLQEILPKWIHPKTNVLISKLIDKLPENLKKTILKVKKP